MKKIYFLTLLCYCLMIEASLATKHISLAPLQCTESDIVGCNVGLRPYRTGGIRLETQSIDDKVIVHDYGHGGSGATLAPGSVAKAMSLFEQREPDKKQVSVLGAGYMGLLTAQELVAAGYQVTIYADQFPTQDYFYQQDNSCITSLVAGGLWMPYGIDHGDEEQFRLLQNKSYFFYKQKIESETPGVSFRTAYSFPPMNENRLPAELDPPEHVEVTFGEKFYPASKWSTILIEGGVFLNDVFATLKSNERVTFIERNLTDLDEVLGLSDTFIFNCTGLGSRHLFGDQAMKAVRGQLLYFKPQPAVNYFLFGGEEHSRFSMFPSADKILVGGTFEEGVEKREVEKAALEKMHGNVSSFFKDKLKKE